MCPKWVLLIFIVVQVNCEIFNYTDLVEGVNNFTLVAQTQNWFKFTKSFTFPGNSDPILAFATINVTQASAGGVDVYFRACIPPSVGLWQTTYSSAGCSQQKQSSASPCLLNIFPCDTAFQRGDSYWILLSGIPSNTPTLNVSIFINSTSSPAQRSIPGAIDTLNPYQRKTYYFPISETQMQSIQFASFTIRSVNFSNAYISVSSTLSFGTVNATSDYASIANLVFPFPSMPFMSITVCKASVYAKLRNGTFGSDAFVHVSSTGNLGSYSVDSNISYTAPQFLSLNVSSVLTTTVPVGGYSFIKFVLPPNREWYDYSILVNVTSNTIQNGSVAVMTMSPEQADPEFPAYGCSSFGNQFFSSSQPRNRTILLSVASYGAFPVMNFGFQVLSGSTPYTFEVKVVQTPITSTYSAFDLAIGTPSNFVSFSPSIMSSTAYYRFPLNMASLPVGAEISVTVFNMYSNTPTPTSGKVSINIGRGYQTAAKSKGCNSAFYTNCTLNWDVCGSTNSVPSSPYFYFSVTSNGYTYAWQVIVNFNYPIYGTLNMNSPATITVGPSQRLIFPIISFVSNPFYSIVVNAFAASTTGLYITIYGSRANSTTYYGDTCYKTTLITFYHNNPNVTSSAYLMTSENFGGSFPAWIVVESVNDFSTFTLTLTPRNTSVYTLINPDTNYTRVNVLAGVYPQYKMYQVQANQSFLLNWNFQSPTPSIAPIYYNQQFVIIDNVFTSLNPTTLILPPSFPYNATFIYTIPKSQTNPIYLYTYANNDYVAYDYVSLIPSQTTVNHTIPLWSEISQYAPWCDAYGNFSSDTRISLKQTTYAIYNTPLFSFSATTIPEYLAQADIFAKRSSETLDSIFRLPSDQNSSCQAAYRRFSCRQLIYSVIPGSFDFAPLCLEDCMSISDACGNQSCFLSMGCKYFGTKLKWCNPQTSVPTPSSTPGTTPAPTPTGSVPTPEPTPIGGGNSTETTDSPTMQPSTSTTTSISQALINSSSASSMVAIIAAVVAVGVLLLIGCIIFGIVLLVRRRKRQTEREMNDSTNLPMTDTGKGASEHYASTAAALSTPNGQSDPVTYANFPNKQTPIFDNAEKRKGGKFGDVVIQPPSNPNAPQKALYSNASLVSPPPPEPIKERAIYSNSSLVGNSIPPTQPKPQYGIPLPSSDQLVSSKAQYNVPIPQDIPSSNKSIYASTSLVGTVQPLNQYNSTLLHPANETQRKNSNEILASESDPSIYASTSLVGTSQPTRPYNTTLLKPQPQPQPQRQQYQSTLQTHQFQQSNDYGSQN